VVLAGSKNPIPSRTRPLNSPAPMVLSLKTWKSRSLPGLQRTELNSSPTQHPSLPQRRPHIGEARASIQKHQNPKNTAQFIHPKPHGSMPLRLFLCAGRSTPSVTDPDDMVNRVSPTAPDRFVAGLIPSPSVLRERIASPDRREPIPCAAVNIRSALPIKSPGLEHGVGGVAGASREEHRHYTTTGPNSM
jgi:hypothetical protein